MFSRALRGALSRRRWASALTQRNGPLARPMSPSGDGVGGEQFEDRDRIGARPFAQRPGLVPADRARGREADQRHPAAKLHDRARGPSPRKPRRRCEPSGSVASIPPRDEPLVDLVEDLGEGRRARGAQAMPPPVAKPRSARTRCSPRVLMAARVMNSAYRLSSGTRNVACCGAARGSKNRWSRQIGAPAVDAIDHRHPRPERGRRGRARSRPCAAASRGSSRLERHDPRIELTWFRPSSGS